MKPIHPNIWAVGDLQGCNSSLQALLAHPDIADDPHVQLWFCGDLINRGPGSRKTLDTIMGLGSRAVCVLGNHDLHILGVAAGVRRMGRRDTAHDILEAADAQHYIDWLRHQRLAHQDAGHLMVHAGVLPAWSVKQTLALAQEVESLLQSAFWQDAMQELYGNQPTQWHSDLRGPARWRLIVNALTRMRLCRADGSLAFPSKNKPVWEADLMPWFDVPSRRAQETTIVFGHWSALGLMMRPNLMGLDTGCVWGRQLTAVRLSDRKQIQIDCDSPRKRSDPNNAAR